LPQGLYSSRPTVTGLTTPCGYLSQSLNPAEQNYQIYDRELLAVVKVFKQWRPYLIDNEADIIVYTDHQNLTYFHTGQRLTPRQSRWQFILSEYRLKFHHLPGISPLLRLPDALSRRSDYSPSDELDKKIVLLPDDLFASTVDLAIANALRLPDPLSDPIIRLAADALAGHISPPPRSSLADWRFEDDILYFKNRAYVPPTGRHHLVSLHHDTSTAGHPGRFGTEDILKRDYWWPSMSSYVHNYVDGCATCQQMKSDTHPSAPALHPIPSESTRPYSQISVDLITDLPISAGFDSIMVVVDHGLTKGVIISPCNKTITAEGVADIFLERVFSRFGLPEKMISDRGPQFASKFTIELGKLLGYKNALSVAYHPQTDGQTERLNQELETYLRIYCRTDPHSWSKNLALAEFTHNHRTHSTQKSSPFFLLYGYEP